MNYLSVNLSILNPTINQSLPGPWSPSVSFSSSAELAVLWHHKNSLLLLRLLCNVGCWMLEAAAATSGYKYLLSGKKWEALNNSVRLETTRGDDCTSVLKTAWQLVSTRLPVEVSTSRGSHRGGATVMGWRGVQNKQTNPIIANSLKAVCFKWWTTFSDTKSTNEGLWPCWLWMKI